MIHKPEDCCGLKKNQKEGDKSKYKSDDDSNNKNRDDDNPGWNSVIIATLFQDNYDS